MPEMESFFLYNKAASLAAWRVEFKDELCLVCTKAKQSSLQAPSFVARVSNDFSPFFSFGLCKPCKLYICVILLNENEKK